MEKSSNQQWVKVGRSEQSKQYKQLPLTLQELLTILGQRKDLQAAIGLPAGKAKRA